MEEHNCCKMFDGKRNDGLYNVSDLSLYFFGFDEGIKHTNLKHDRSFRCTIADR